ncbi:VOC family protein [Nonomuraea terrae]|uniref:VOC family protein n=1 Tax=Nonomuraea terrae TaxID=2530383 RepID=UPI0037AD9F54
MSHESTLPLRLGSVTVTVPDPAATGAFLHDGLGFHVTPRADGGLDATTGGEYAQPVPRRHLTLLPGEAARLREVTFDVPAGYAFGELERRAAAHGMTTEPVAADAGGGAGVAVTGPSGLRLVCRPPGAPVIEALPATPLRPRRLGHVNVKVPDAPATAAALTALLDLKLSEQIGEGLFFFRVGSEHHNMGVRGGSDVPDVHHLAFEVAGWDSYRMICDHLADLGYKVEYGPGRHGPGHNLFVYVRDPSSGLRLELYSDMAHIHDEASYTPPRWEMSDRGNTVNRWGPAPPESFLA